MQRLGEIHGVHDESILAGGSPRAFHVERRAFPLLTARCSGRAAVRALTGPAWTSSSPGRPRAMASNARTVPRGTVADRLLLPDPLATIPRRQPRSRWRSGPRPGPMDRLQQPVPDRHGGASHHHLDRRRPSGTALRSHRSRTAGRDVLTCALSRAHQAGRPSWHVGRAGRAVTERVRLRQRPFQRMTTEPRRRLRVPFPTR